MGSALSAVVLLNYAEILPVRQSPNPWGCTLPHEIYCMRFIAIENFSDRDRGILKERDVSGLFKTFSTQESN
ncbi:MAG: hypothetical protein MH252_10895 [Thermosynechococcaceae cyanobacterium MS004]|nr:hypothetical protein [Thermosynechococcaceae cyanobacterium MS004]